MVFLAVLIVLFNTSPRWTGITHIGEGATVVPIMSDAFWAYAPWLTLVWGAELMLKAVVLLRGRWGVATRIVNIVISGAGLFILFRMLTSPEPLLAFAPAPRLACGAGRHLHFCRDRDRAADLSPHQARPQHISNGD